ncbi:hypothetical protein MTP04_22760 [Lysinibacillus sp. PLM2]|nr:hypothetical protein MTP04_22760 [Lysinibacillus sp. PLM2]
MKPVLVVEGKQYEVVSINYYGNLYEHVMVRDENDNLIVFYDEVTNMYKEQPLKINISKSLVWANRYEPIIERIQKRIDGEEENQTDRAIQYIENKGLEVFNNMNLQQEYERKSHFIDGLIEALEEIDKVISGDEDE